MADEARQKFEEVARQILAQGITRKPAANLFDRNPQYPDEYAFRDAQVAWETYSAGMRAGEVAQREFVIDLLDKRMRRMLDIDGKEGAVAENVARAECFHLMEIQRILRGQPTCGVYDDYGKVPAENGKAD